MVAAMDRRGKGPRRAIVALIAALGLASLGLLVGCGGSSGESTETVSTTTETTPTGTPGPNASTGLTMPEFIAAADAICADENEKLKPTAEALEAAGESAESQDELDAVLDEARVYLKEFEAGMSRLRALPPPRGKVGVINTMLTASSASQLAVEALFEALDEGNRVKLATEKEQIKLLQAKYRGLAQGLGFHECGAS
jgi:uncharacterized protein HemX